MKTLPVAGIEPGPPGQLAEIVITRPHQTIVK